MAIPPIDVPIRVDKEAALAAIRETEAAHKTSLDRMDANTRASFAKTKAAAADMARQLQVARSDPLMGSSPALYTAETNKATAATVALGRATEQTGRSATSAFRSAGGVLRSLSAGIGAATAAAAGSERSFIALGTSILSAFAAGGPIAGGLAIVAGGIGWLAGNTKEAEEAAKKARLEYDDWLDGVKNKAREAAEGIEKIEDATAALGEKGPAADVLIAQRQVDRARRAALEAAQFREFFRPSGGQDPAGVVRAVGRNPNAAFPATSEDPEGETKAIKDLVAKVEELKAAEGRLAALRKTEGASAAIETSKADLEKIATADKLIASTKKEIEVLEQKTAIEREVMRLIQERDAALDSGMPASVANAKLGLQVDEARTAEAARYKAEIEDRAREEERAAKALNDWLDDEIEKREKLEKSSAEFLRHAEGLLSTEVAIEGVARDRVEAELEVAEAIAAGTLAAKDQEAALRILLELAKAKRDNAKAKEDAATLKREQEEARRNAEREAEVRADATEDVERQLRALRASTDQERAILEIEDKIADLRKKGVPENLLGQLQAELVKKALSGSDPIREYLDAIAPTLSGGLSELIADGIETGFENASEIGTQLFRTLLRQLLNELVSSGIKEAIAGLFGGVGGGSSGGGIFGAIIGGLGSILGGGGGGGVVTAIGGAIAPAVGAGSGVDLGSVLGGGCAGGT